jgi:HK97 family phage prohead protease
VKTALQRRKSVRPFEIKSVENNGEFSGYGSVFNVKDSYGDIVIPGAFSNTLTDWGTKNKLPKMLWQHDSTEPIGVWTEMKEDAHGLFVKGRILLDAGPTERRAYEHIKAGSIDGLSIGYTIAPKGISYDKEQDAYLLKQVNLWEVSPVTFPANGEAGIDAVKSIVDAGPREFERFLREAGLSRSQAKGLMARGFDGLRDPRDADETEDEVVKMAENLLGKMRALRAEGK